MVMPYQVKWRLIKALGGASLIVELCYCPEQQGSTLTESCSYERVTTLM